MTHTYAFFDGFEVQADAGSEARWGGLSGTPTVELTLTSLSRAALRWSLSASTGFVQYFPALTTSGTWDSVSRACWDVSFHMYIVSLPTSGLFYYFASFHRSVGSVLLSDFRIQDDGTFQVYNNATGTRVTSSAQLEIGKWYVVSLRHYQNSTLRCIVRNRDTQATVESLTHGSASQNDPIRELRLGAVTASTGDVIFDNFVAETNDTAANIDDPVNDLGTKYACGLLLPNGTGYYDTGWSGTYADDDEVPHDGDTTKRDATTTYIFTENMTPTSSLVAQVSSVKATMHFAFLRRSAAVAVLADLRIRSSGTDVDSANIGTGDAYYCYQLLRTTDPATSAAWTVTGLDGVQVGVERTNSGSVLYCTLVGLEVLYITMPVSRRRRIGYVMDVWDADQAIMAVDRGQPVPYNELRADNWLLLEGVATPDAEAPDEFYDYDGLVMIEGVDYTANPDGSVTVSIQGSPDDFVNTLIQRIANSAAAV